MKEVEGKLHVTSVKLKAGKTKFVPTYDSSIPLNPWSKVSMSGYMVSRIKKVMPTLVEKMILRIAHVVEKLEWRVQKCLTLLVHHLTYYVTIQQNIPSTKETSQTCQEFVFLFYDGFFEINDLFKVGLWYSLLLRRLVFYFDGFCHEIIFLNLFEPHFCGNRGHKDNFARHDIFIFNFRAHNIFS